MKIFIGKYHEWWGAYQLANLLQKVNVSEECCDKIGDWLTNTKVHTFCKWIDSKKKRNIKIRIDVYDTWNMDSTLAYIILPMLKQLKESQQSRPDVDDKDVPKELRSTSAPKKENEWDTDDNWFKRWDWILDEMIWTFSQVNDEDWEAEYHGEIEAYGGRHNWEVIDKGGLEAHRKRMKNGFELFGKYYQSLWD